MAFFPGKSAMMIQPIGLTVIGGLTSSTFITLFFIPVMYSFINEHRGKGKHGKHRGRFAFIKKEETEAGK
jgi:HAE1 family hydrophobic/amphiphilic exporter-1